MDHADVRETLEIAAAEPGGLDRLMAGDTADARAVAGHLAGCEECTTELESLRRTAAILRDVVPSEAPVDLPPDLRERTLAYVRELGVPRPAVAAVAAGDVVAIPVGERTVPAAERTDAPAAERAEAPGAGPVDLRAERTRRRPILRPSVWFVSIAAAILISVVGTTLVMNSRSSDEAAALQEVASWSVDIASSPDAHHVVLSAPSGPAAGTLSFSASNGGLVVVADALAPAPAGQEYRCWFEDASGRWKVGKMYFSGDIAYWVGDVDGLGQVDPGTKFGVSLESIDGSDISGPPVLLGTV